MKARLSVACEQVWAGLALAEAFACLKVLIAVAQADDVSKALDELDSVRDKASLSPALKLESEHEQLHLPQCCAFHSVSRPWTWS